MPEIHCYLSKSHAAHKGVSPYKTIANCKLITVTSKGHEHTILYFEPKNWNIKKRNLQLQCNSHLQADFPSQNKGWPWRAVTRDLSPPWLLKMFPWSFRFLLQRNGWCKKLLMCAFVCGAARKRRPVELLSVSATSMPFSGWRRTKYLLFCRDLGNETSPGLSFWS